MSAWYVMSAMGFYAVDPASGTYVFGSPLFDRVSVKTSQAQPFIVEAKRSSPNDAYIQVVQRDGRSHERLWFTAQDITGGATFHITMGSTPNKTLGAAQEHEPPSASSAKSGTA